MRNFSLVFPVFLDWMENLNKNEQTVDFMGKLYIKKPIKILIVS